MALVLLACACIRVAFWTYGADTGTFAIAIQNVPHAMYDPFEGGSHFRFHWSPILAALYPLLAVVPSVLALQILQILLVVGAVFAYYSLIEPYLGAPLALRCAIVALLYPPLIALAFSEFHELAFAPILTFLALRAVSLRKWTWYALCAVLLSCVREDVALLTGLFGALLVGYGLLPCHRELVEREAHPGIARQAPVLRQAQDDKAFVIAGIATMIGDAIVLLLYFGVLIPHLGGWVPSAFYAYPYHNGIVAVARQILTVGRLTYLLEVVVPLALLPLLTPWFWLAVPGLAIVLLANSGEVWRMGMHYVALWLPWVLLAMAAGVSQIHSRAGERAAAGWVSVATALCVLFLIFFNPTHAAHYLRPGYADMSAVRQVMHCVPADAMLATHDEWYAAMAFRHPNVTIGPSPSAAYWLLADDYPNAEFQEKGLPEVRRQVANGAMKEICRSDRVAVYRRVRQ